MKKFDTGNIRNVSVVGPKGSGKTTFLESVLFTAKVTGRQGSVDQENSTLDNDPLEIERKQSLTSKFVPVEWNGTKINFMDTPGYADFWGEAVGAMAATDIALFVVEAGSGADIATGRLIEYSNKLNKPCAFLINKMNSERADVDEAFKTIKEKVSGAFMAYLPIGKGSEFKGVVDLIDMKAYTFDGGKVNSCDIPEDLKSLADEKRTELIESVAESDEVLLEKYLEGGDINQEEIKSAMKKGLAQKIISPVFFAASDCAMGTEVILRTLVNYFPSPEQMPVPAVTDSNGAEVELKPEPNSKAVAQVFKVTSDPGIGDIFFFRVWSGTINSGDDVHNTSKNSNERMGHLLILRGKDREEADLVTAGDIVSVAKLKESGINDTLCGKGINVQMPKIEFPNPVVSLAMKPLAKKDQDRLGVALQKLTATDPTFKYHVDKEFAETIVTGMGELHIEMMVKKLKEKYNVDVELGKPHIPYREAISKKAAKQGKHKKQSGGHGQYGDCSLRLEPLPNGGTFEFKSEIVGGAIPSKYIPAIEKGVKESMQKGVLAGYPVVGVRVVVIDGSYHDVDSSDLAFQIAGAMAFKAAMKDANPKLLEPIIDLEVYAPQDYLGDISSDISSRRGRVANMDAGCLTAKVPLAELYQYSATLRSITSGAGTYTMSFSKYEAVPAHISQKIIDDLNKEKGEEK